MGTFADVQIRELTERDAQASLAMSHEAFGSGRDTAHFTIGDGVWRWGIFDGDLLVAKANDRSYQSTIGGREVPTAGVAGVAVLAEYRGRGLARRLMGHVLAAAKDRGAVVSTLFRTAPALYRSLGYEQTAELTYARLPTAALSSLRIPAGVTVRRATAADGPAIRSLYDEFASGGSGLLTRRGPNFGATDDELVASYDGISLVEQGGRPTGYASWNRSPGYGAGATLSVSELVAGTPQAHLALLAALGSFGAVVPTIELRTSGTDPVHWFIPGAGWSVQRVEPYLTRALDLVGAVSARGWPGSVTGELTVRTDDPVCQWNSGTYRFELSAGQGRLTRVETATGERGGPASAAAADEATLTVTPGGWALLLTGGVGVAPLRRAGLIQGGNPDSVLFLEGALAGPRPAILDVF